MFVGGVKTAPMKQRFIQSNAELHAIKSPLALTSAEEKTLDRLLTTISDQTNFHVAPFSDDEAKLVEKLISWPSDKVIAVLDAFRILMIHEAAIEKLNGTLRTKVFDHLAVGKNAIPVVRALTNWVAKRRRTASERSGPRPSVPADVTSFILEALDKCASADGFFKDNNVVEAYTLFVHNIICWVGRLGIEQSDLYLIIASGLVTEVLSVERPPKVLFYALLTIASMAFASQAARQAIKESFEEQLIALARLGISHAMAAVQEVAQDMVRVYGLTL